MRLVRSNLFASLCLLAGAAGCGQPAPDAVLIELAPDVISSIDGTTTVSALVIGEREPLPDQSVRIDVAYTDRNGDPRVVESVDAVSDDRGAVSAVISGLAWEGTGTVTATVVETMVAGAATFAVLDRTPPVVEILDPTTDNRVGPGLPVEVEVRVSDEIGVSEVFIEADGEVQRSRSTVVASGSTDATVTFRFDVPDNAVPGPTITLYAVASDLSGNQAAAVPVVLTVDPSIAIATPPGLTGEPLTDPDNPVLGDPRALAKSPRSGKLYVADNSGGSCNGACIREVDAETGAVSPTPVITGFGDIEGVAFDASGDNLYYTDRQDRISRLTWNATAMRYESATLCNAFDQQNPQDPYHLVHDATLGAIVVDDDRQLAVRQAACTGLEPTDFSDQAFDTPRGIAQDADGGFYVSDANDDVVYFVDRNTGDVTRFEDRDLDLPWGMAWLAGGTSVFADSLMIAERGDRTISSSTGLGTRAAAYLRNDPIDVEVDGTTMYVLTRPSAGDPGRVFVVTGF